MPGEMQNQDHIKKEGRKHPRLPKKRYTEIEIPRNDEWIFQNVAKFLHLTVYQLILGLKSEF
jgi:hypothetical protein